MMNLIRKSMGMLFGLTLVGCAMETEEPTGTISLALQGSDHGTKLSLQPITPTVGLCRTKKGVTQALVRFDIHLKSTGSADSAIITVVNVDSADPKLVIDHFTVEPQDFEHEGRNKTFLLEGWPVNLKPDVKYSVCATQSGAHGRKAKRTCPLENFTVQCPELAI